MSMGTHLLAVRIAEVEASGGLNTDDFLSTPGIDWCGDTFETGYVFNEQMDTILTPFASPPLRSVLRGESVAFSHWILDQFTALEEALEITALTPEMYQEFRGIVAHAVANSDWDGSDTYEWDQLLADTSTSGDFYVIAEFV